MKLSEIQDQFGIEMVETGQGCPEACLHCGAYPDFSTDSLRSIEIDKEQLETNLSQVSGATGLRIIECLCPYIATHVNVEPLRSDSFLHLAKFVHDLSNNHSRMIAISHGIHAGNRKMQKRLESIVELMEQEVVPLFVLTVDHARSKGKIDPRNNLKSYLRTLEILKEALGFGRITASLQGTRNPDSPLYIGKTREMFEEVLGQAGFGDEERNRLVIDDRSYTKAGRAQDLNGGAESEDCDVIPDPEFLKSEFPRPHLWRGLITGNGAILAQPNRLGQTYGDSVNTKLWEPVEL